MIDDKAEFIRRGFASAAVTAAAGVRSVELHVDQPPHPSGRSRGPMNDTQCLAAIYSRTDAHKDLIVSAAKGSRARSSITSTRTG